MTLVLSNDDVQNLLTMPECLDALEQAYIELAEGRGVNRNRSDCLTPTSNPDAVYGLKSMDGVVPKLGLGAIRINSDVVTFPKKGNTVVREKLPAARGRYVGLVLLFSSETGEPLAILPDGVMQRMRVGAANGLGVKTMARADARTVGILGCGWQAGAQLMAACAVREIESVRCYSPTRERREAFAAEMQAMLGTEITPVEQPEDAVHGADIVMCASNSLDPVFFAHWIEPGMHLSSIKLPEIEMSALRRADRVAVHSRDSSPQVVTPRDFTLGKKAKEHGWSVGKDIDFEKLPTLPELIAGYAQGRASDQEVTCFLNNIGLGYQFAAVGAVLYRKATEAGAGHELPTDWFTQDVHP